MTNLSSFICSYVHIEEKQSSTRLSLRQDGVLGIGPGNVTPDFSQCIQPKYSINIFIYLYIYIYMCVCVSVCVCACTCIYIYGYIAYTCAYIYIGTHLYIYIYIYIDIHILHNMCMYMYVYVYLYNSVYVCRAYALLRLSHAQSTLRDNCSTQSLTTNLYTLKCFSKPLTAAPIMKRAHCSTVASRKSR